MVDGVGVFRVVGPELGAVLVVGDAETDCERTGRGVK